MAKSDITALLEEDGTLRGVIFSPRGHEGWTRTGGGAWPLEEPAKPQQLAGQAALDATIGELTKAAEPASEKPPEATAQAEGTVVASDTPLARALAAARKDLGARQVVIGLPLSRLLVRILKIPVAAREDLQSAVALQLDKISPFPGEELTVGCEVLSETEKDLWVFAAALPQVESDKLAESMHLAKLQVVRVDASVLGWFRSLCGPCEMSKPGLRVTLLNPDGGWDLLVLDDGVPMLVRGLGSLAVAAVAREVMLSLMDVEQLAGASKLEEVLVVTKNAAAVESLKASLAGLLDAPVKVLPLPGADGGVEGIALRAGESAQLNLTPQAWVDEVRISAIRTRVIWGAGAAAAVWVLFMGALFAGPFVYGQMTAHARKLSAAHQKMFKKVSDTRERVNLIKSYTDRTYSSLEVLKMISENLPEGITLTAITYRRTDSVKIAGEADQPSLVYDFKDAVTRSPLFEQVTLTGPSQTKDKHKFEVNAMFKGVQRK